MIGSSSLLSSFDLFLIEGLLLCGVCNVYVLCVCVCVRRRKNPRRYRNLDLLFLGLTFSCFLLSLPPSDSSSLFAFDKVTEFDCVSAPHPVAVVLLVVLDSGKESVSLSLPLLSLPDLDSGISTIFLVLYVCISGVDVSDSCVRNNVCVVTTLQFSKNLEKCKKNQK